MMGDKFIALWAYYIETNITRTWIRRLNFTQRPIFQAWGSLTSLKTQTRDILKSLPEDLCSWLLCPEKIHRPQPGLNPRTLDLEASTLSRGRLIYQVNFWSYRNRFVTKYITYLNTSRNVSSLSTNDRLTLVWASSRSWSAALYWI